jgi:Spy/CpxP family protein refolding chaperone
MKGGTKMKSIKIIISLFLMLTLPMATFAAPPKGHKPPPSHHHDYHHGHHHDYYYSSNNYARNAIFTLLGLSAIAAVAVAASKASKKQKVVVVEQQYQQVAQDLTLTQAQQDQVRKLFDTNREKLTPIRDEKALKTIALEQELEKENPDQALVNKLENEISQLSMSIFRITQDTKTQLQTILTPEQYEAMEEMKL